VRDVRDRAESFRQWLLERLLGTRWARVALTDDQIDAVARRLGVSSEILLEARAQTKIVKHASGLPNAISMAGRVAGEYRTYYQYHLFMPPVVWKAWADECKFREVKGSLLLRSMIHDYLSFPRSVAPLRQWRYQDKTYKMGEHGRTHFLERAQIPHGAKRALEHRARQIGALPTWVVRALVLEALAGLHRDIRLIEATMMYDDESRYLSPPKSDLTQGDPRG
jgi:hypothetical protein